MGNVRYLKDDIKCIVILNGKVRGFLSFTKAQIKISLDRIM